jgi:uncharacterized membrane protein
LYYNLHVPNGFLIGEIQLSGPSLTMFHHARSSARTMWLIPLAYALGAIIVASIVPRVSFHVLPQFVSTISVNSAIGIYSSIASGMISLTAIVFSLTFVMVQFSATAYSPRLVLWIASDPVMSHAIGVFTATFLYALASLAWVDRAGSGRVPLVGIVVVEGLVIVSVLMFIGLIQRVGMLQVTRMLIFTGDQGREVIEALYPPIDAPATLVPAEISKAKCVQRIFHHGRPQFVRAIDIPGLIELASRNGCLFELSAAVGDAVLDSTPILTVWGETGPLPEKDLRKCLDLGNERTFEQDPKYAIRLLVDIAIKALSPAVNDPTTAVQALDQIEDLLIRLGRRRLEIGAFRDSAGHLRLVADFPAWEDFLRLAFDEIRYYGANSVQVMRRMKAVVIETISVLPEERRPSLQYWQERIQATVDHTFADTEDRIDASTEDRQGLGTSRRRRASQ